MINGKWFINHLLLLYALLGVVNVVLYNVWLFYLGFIVVMYTWIKSYIDIFKHLNTIIKKKEK